MNSQLAHLDSETKVSESPHAHKDELRLWLRLLTCTNLVEAAIRKRLAEQFDITRDVPPDHLAFGHGPHKCPGQHMARAVISIGVEALLSRLHGLRIDELEWDTDALLFRGPAKLVLAWDESRPRG